MARSIVRRVAAGAALAAAAAALVSALATIALATWLVQREEDRRIEEAAVTFAAELRRGPSDAATLRAVHHDESEEMEHTGLLFAVYARDGARLVGDRRVSLPSAEGCATPPASALRVCRAAGPGGLAAVVGAPRRSWFPALLAAALLAALFAAALAWAASRPVSRRVVAPLTRLRERLGALDVDALGPADLGADERVAEVDALRATLSQLISRVQRTLALSQRFAANAAHELRTPLTAVRAELELLAERLEGADEREAAARAQRKIAELAALTERLLVLSTPARAASTTHEAVSLRDLLEDVAHELSAEERARVRVTEGDALVRGDAALLSVAVANALGNALKFGGAVETEVRASGPWAVLRFDDDGPGLDGAERELVFEAFYRGSDAARRRAPGHGLGLALLRHVVEAHGGTAAFVDKPTRGARLELRLPRLDAPPAPAQG